MYVLRILSDYEGGSTEHDGLYIRTYDPDAFDGRGNVSTTPDPRMAAIFPNSEAAEEFWVRPSTVKPALEDGTPNCPLLAYYIRIERLDGFYSPGEIAEPEQPASMYH